VKQARYGRRPANGLRRPANLDNVERAAMAATPLVPAADAARAKRKTGAPAIS